jgi:transcription elongation factor GreA
VVEGERLTQKQATALREELAELEGPRRTEVVAAIKKAREFGDLSENFEYHAAKNEQGLLEARIRTLRARLDGAEIVEQAGSDEVGIGSIVDIEGDSGQKLTVEISAVGGSGTVSPTSPLGSALLGRKVGDSVAVQAPKGSWTATVARIHQP